MYIALILLCAGAFAVPHTSRPIYDLNKAEELFEKFIVDFDKHYGSEAEKQKRFEIFKDKLRYINDMNSDPTENAEFGITHFTDIHKDEFGRINGFFEQELPLDIKNKMVNVSRPVNIKIPENFNWVDHNVVTPVKDQGYCGSCWAFSTTGVIEGAYAKKHKHLVSLSEQQLVDCDKKSDGCTSGVTFFAIKYLMEAGGSQSESSYPYTAKKGTCKFNSTEVAVKVAKFAPLRLEDEDALRELLYVIGPISIIIDGHTLMQHQGSGIIMNCESEHLNHAVLLVGYGTSSEGIKYWIIKNSWGTKIGEGGYQSVVRGKNSCGMMNAYAMSVETV